MNREQLEESAKQYGLVNFKPDEAEAAKRGFKAGAEWRIDVVWHNMNEKPNGRFVILADFGQEEYSLGINLEGIESAKRWAYISDLLPERKEETE